MFSALRPKSTILGNQPQDGIGALNASSMLAASGESWCILKRLHLRISVGELFTCTCRFGRKLSD